MAFRILSIPTGSTLLWQEPVLADGYGNRLTTLDGISFAFTAIADPATEGPAVLTATVGSGITVLGRFVRIAISTISALVAGRTYYWSLRARDAAGNEWLVCQGVVNRYLCPAGSFDSVTGQIVTDNDGAAITTEDGAPIITG